MYYQYWGLAKPPFDNVPDPTMYVESHASVENAIAESLFAIEEGNECLAVIIGEVGSGKSLSLRLILDALDQQKYRIAFITNPDMSFVQLLNEIIGQLTGEVSCLKRKLELLEAFNRLLFTTAEEGKKVVILIDEANAMTGPNLESLRLLTNMQSDDKNLFTLVLAGQIELAKKLEHRRRANLFQRIGAYCRIEKIESIEVLKDYIETRLRRAGGRKMVFTDASLATIWEASEYGVPRLVNKICKLSMKAGETNGFLAIDEPVVRQVADRFRKLVTSVPPPVPKQETPNSSKVSRRAIPRPVTSVPSAPELARADESDSINQDFPEISEAKADNFLSPTAGTEKPQCGEMDANPFPIKVVIPDDILAQARSYTDEKRAKVAGMLAAQTLQNYPQLAFSQTPDPVSLWSDIRASILTALEERARSTA